MKLLYEHDIIKEKNSNARCLKCLKLTFLSLTPNCKTIICIYLLKTYLHGKFTFNFLNSTYDTACCIGISY